MSHFERYFSDAGMWCGSLGNIAASIWGPNPTVPALERSIVNTRAVLKANPAGILTIALIPQLDATMPKLDGDARAVVKGMVKEFSKSTLASVNVIEGSGFWVSASRALLTGFALLGTTPTKVFEQMEPAQAWLRQGKLLAAEIDLVRAFVGARADWETTRQGER